MNKVENATCKTNKEKSLKHKRYVKKEVLVHNDHKADKLDDEWLGPYHIEKTMSPYYEILINNQIKKIHGNRIKPYFSERSSHAQPSSSDWN